MHKESNVPKPIRTTGKEIQPGLHLSPEQLNDYEELERKLDNLTPTERRYYDLLQRWAYLQHVLQVMQMDKFITKL
jgi:hypothetical protein